MQALPQVLAVASVFLAAAAAALWGQAARQHQQPRTPLTRDLAASDALVTPGVIVTSPPWPSCASR
jgi:hypothetical protein